MESFLYKQRLLPLSSMRLRIFSIFFCSMVISCAPEQNNESDKVQNDTLNEKVQNDTVNNAIEYLEKQDFQLLVRRFEDPERKDWQNPDLVIKKLGDLSGKVVADIGAGTGYFTFRLASLAKKVIAVDIDKRFLDFIDERKLEVDNDISDKIEARLTDSDDPALEENEADIVLIVNTYLFIKNRIAYLKKVNEGLSAGGRLVIVDFKPESNPVGPPEELKIPPTKVVSEIMNAGFDQINVDNSSLQYQYIITAE